MPKELKQLEKEINKFTDYFVKRYFDEIPTDMYWIGGEVGDVLDVNDYFFDLVDMRQFVKYNYTKKQMFEYYDYKLETEENIINICNYNKLKK